MQKGMTVLRGVATEPEVQDLARFLCSAGASVEGIGTRTLRIMGTPQLSGARHIVCADRIVASTALCAVAACGGDVCLTGENGAHLAALLHILRRMGCGVPHAGRSADGAAGAALRPGRFVYGCLPGAGHRCGAAACGGVLKSEGFFCCDRHRFENRFACAEGFAAMGGNVKVSGRTLLQKKAGAGCMRLMWPAPDFARRCSLVHRSPVCRQGKAPSAKRSTCPGL